MAKAKCKINKSDSCSKGNHQFIVSNWANNGTTQKANAFTCQFCLISVDGILDIEKLKAETHATGNTETKNS